MAQHQRLVVLIDNQNVLHEKLPVGFSACVGDGLLAKVIERFVAYGTRLSHAYPFNGKPQCPGLEKHPRSAYLFARNVALAG